MLFYLAVSLQALAPATGAPPAQALAVAASQDASSQAGPTEQADPFPVYWEDDNWTVTSDAEGHSCTASKWSQHEDFGEMELRLVYWPLDRMFLLGFTSTVTTSLPEKGEETIEIAFLNNGGIEYDDGWGARNFYYTALPDGSHYFTDIFSGTENVAQISSDISQSSHVGFSHDGNLFAGATLTGSKVALKHLRECAFALNDLNPNDPFVR